MSDYVQQDNYTNEQLYLYRLNRVESIGSQSGYRGFYQNKTVAEIIDSIYNCDIKIGVTDDTITIDEAKGYVDAIHENLKFLQQIAKKPKSFIRTTEQKEYIYKAKKIGTKAIFHLTRDSSDWESRKANSIIPRRILSDVYDESFDIYENRVYCDLIHLILEKIKEAQSAFKKLKDKCTKTKISASISHRRYFKKIEKNTEKTEKDIKDVDPYTKKIKEIKRIVAEIKKSKLYKQVSKVWRKMYSIHKTNIFMFDQKYKPIYKLWVDLNKNEKPKDEAYTIDISKQKQFMEEYYFNYVLICILAVLNKNDDTRIRWDENSENVKIIVDETTGIIKPEKELKFTINNKEITLNVIESKTDKPLIRIKCKKRIKEATTQRNQGRIIQIAEQVKEIEFDICPRYFVDTELFGFKDDQNYGLSEIDVDNLVQNLNQHIVKNKKDDGIYYTRNNFFEIYTEKLLNQKLDDKRHIYYLLPITTKDDELSTDEKVNRRLYGMGGNYDPDDTAADKGKWRFFNRGILQVTPRDCEYPCVYALDSISRLINLHVIFNDTMDDYKTMCPVCNSKNINHGKCWGCNYYFETNSLTKSGHNKDLIWIKQEEGKCQKIIHEYRNTITDTETELKYPDAYICEIISGYAATTSFSIIECIENDKTHFDVKTICPVCGKDNHS